MALTFLDKDASPILSSRSQYFAGASSTSVAGYDAYLSHGPIELSHNDPLHEPLLNQGPISQQSFGVGSPPSPYSHNNASSIYREAPIHRPQQRSHSPSPSYISNAPQFRSQSPAHSRQSSGNLLASSQLGNQTSNPQPYSQVQRGQSPGPQMYPPQQQPNDNNMAGRGVPRRY